MLSRAMVALCCAPLRQDDKDEFVQRATDEMAQELGM
jgi:hypothetical protein